MPAAASGFGDRARSFGPHSRPNRGPTALRISDPASTTAQPRGRARLNARSPGPTAPSTHPASNGAGFRPAVSPAANSAMAKGASAHIGPTAASTARPSRNATPASPKNRPAAITPARTTSGSGSRGPVNASSRKALSISTSSFWMGQTGFKGSGNRQQATGIAWLRRDGDAPPPGCTHCFDRWRVAISPLQHAAAVSPFPFSLFPFPCSLLFPFP